MSKGMLRRFLRKKPAVFTVAFGDGQSGKELLEAGRYDWVGEHARTFAESNEFPVSRDPGTADLELIEFDLDFTSPEVLTEFARLKLERPTAEDALRFAKRFPEEQRRRPIAFLHEPWLDPFEGRDVLVLRGDKRGRGLALYWYDDRWYRGVLFAARRRK